EVVGDVRQLQQTSAGALDTHEQNRISVGICLRDDGRLDVGWQLAHGPRDAVADVVGRALQIGTERELYPDRASTLAARGRNHLDAIDTVDRLLDWLRNLGVDYVRIGTAIGRRDTDDGRINGRVLANPEERQRKQAEDDDDQ